ncbi:phospholipase A and acyltransferase 4-like [Hippoglossus stenolepis]|uniref:phospholipase A and acyltransferase 4-like n=1 Tax=Hippoglossus stenolepis TaxID=195615 RepID=UPI001FAEDCFE|nr:phospholipase A and acyltransferase 4-like [Hippoglossus stenolepis]
MAPTFNGKPGDLIEIFRKDYQHWAVYIGENEVVHFTTGGGQSSGSLRLLSSSAGKVKREKLADVVGNDRYQVNNLLDNRRKAREPSVIVMEARAMVGRELSYNVATYNCEHFAVEMRYGKAESLQVIKTLITVAIVTPVAAVVAGPVVAIAAVAVGAFALCRSLFSSRSSS